METVCSPNRWNHLSHYIISKPTIQQYVIFIVAPCILISIKYSQQQMHLRFKFFTAHPLSKPEALCNISYHVYDPFLWSGFPTLKIKGYLLVRCRNSLLNALGSGTPYLEIICYIRNLRTRHDMVNGGGGGGPKLGIRKLYLKTTSSK
jgi:hypothetical protein